MTSMQVFALLAVLDLVGLLLTIWVGKKYPDLAAEQRIVGIPKSSEYLKEFGDRISSIQRNVPCVYPDRLIDLSGNDTHGIFVVHVPLSPLMQHCHSVLRS